MKKLNLLISFCFLISCNKKVVEDEKNIIESEDYINFDEGGSPDFFKAKTLNKGIFDSKKILGKNVVLVINRVDQEGHIAEGFNELIKKNKDKNVTFLLIIDGRLEADHKIENITSLYDSSTIFIDNTNIVFKNKPQINHSIHCWPANILMDTKGKVVYSICGGYGFSDEYEYKLDSLVNYK